MRGGQDRTADRDGALAPSCELEAALRRSAEIPTRLGEPLDKMAYRLKTPRGRKLYGLRKQTPEPVFGIIKSVMGYRQCLLRGLENVKGEWNLVTMTWNIKRMFAMQPC